MDSAGGDEAGMEEGMEAALQQSYCQMRSKLDQMEEYNRSLEQQLANIFSSITATARTKQNPASSPGPPALAAAPAPEPAPRVRDTGQCDESSADCGAPGRAGDKKQSSSSLESHDRHSVRRPPPPSPAPRSRCPPRPPPARSVSSPAPPAVPTAAPRAASTPRPSPARSLSTPVPPQSSEQLSSDILSSVIRNQNKVNTLLCTAAILLSALQILHSHSFN